jgi:hypothetical protein
MYAFAFSQVMDVSTGKVVANISGVAGSDQVAYLMAIGGHRVDSTSLGAILAN